MDINKLSVNILPCVYRALITTFSFIAILPISESGYEKGCFVAASVFLLSKITETLKVQSEHKKLHKHIAPVLIMNMISSVFSMYFCWGFDTISDKCNTTLVLFIIITWAMLVSGYDYYDLSETVNSYWILEEYQKKAKNDEE